MAVLPAVRAAVPAGLLLGMAPDDPRTAPATPPNLDELIKNGKIKRPWSGMITENVLPAPTADVSSMRPPRASTR